MPKIKHKLWTLNENRVGFLGPLMSASPFANLAEKYFVDDLPGASISGARLNGILKKIETGETLGTLGLSFLMSNGLFAIQTLANGQIDLGAFREQATLERASRIQAAKAKATEQAEEQARTAAAMDAAIIARFAALENDPVLRRKREASELKSRFDVGFIAAEHYERVMRLLKQVSAGIRLTPEDVAWFSIEASDCWTEKLQQSRHRLEAEALARAWEKDGNLWDAFNASSHWRKAAHPNKALEVTAPALARAGRNPSARSALLTTRGGAMRDLGRISEANALGLEAHDLSPADFRPCTLLGAVSMQLGDFAAGHAWYQRAESLGAEDRVIDQELRALLARTSSEAGNQIRAYLLAQDPERFSWLRT